MVPSPLGHEQSFGFEKQFAGSRSSGERSRLALAALPTRPLARLRLATTINPAERVVSRPVVATILTTHYSPTYHSLFELPWARQQRAKEERIHPMEQNHCPSPGNGEPGFGFSLSTGSWLDIDLSGGTGFTGSETDPGSCNWESDWIDLGGEG
jgi:hypothetical protein